MSGQQKPIGAPRVIEDLDRLGPHRTVEAKNEKEFRTTLDQLDPKEIEVVVLGKVRRGYIWEPLAVYWSGAPEYDSRGRLDVPMPTQEELKSYARKYGVRFAKGAVQTEAMEDNIRG